MRRNTMRCVPRCGGEARCGERLDGGGEADSLVGHVELRVVAADEHVAQDPQRPIGGRHVDAHEPGQAHRLTELVDLQYT